MRCAALTENALYNELFGRLAQTKNTEAFPILCMGYVSKRTPTISIRKEYAVMADGTFMPVLIRRTGNGLADGLIFSLLDERYAKKGSVDD